MSFNWRLYIQLANELINYKKGSFIQEAYLRSAISRSYYSVFCIARNLLINKGTTIPMCDTHKFARKEYQNSTNRIEKKVAKGLSRLWKDRKDADYEDNVIIDKNRATTSYQLSLRLLGKLNKLK